MAACFNASKSFASRAASNLHSQSRRMPTGRGRFLEPPVAPNALPDVMAAITGDGSPASYIEASIFAREIAENSWVSSLLFEVRERNGGDGQASQGAGG